MQKQRLFTSWYDDPSLRLIIPFVCVVHAVFISYSILTTSQKPFLKPVENRLVVQTVSLQSNSPPKSVPKKEIALKEKQLLIPEPEPVSLVEETPQEPEPLVEAPKELPASEPKKIAAESRPEKKAEIKQPKKTPKKSVKKEAPKPLPKKESQPIAKKETPKKAEPKAVADKTPPKKPQTPSKPKADPQAEAAKAKQRQLLNKAQESIAKISQSRDKVIATKATNLPGPSVPGHVESLHIDALPTVELKSLSKSEVGYCDELATRLKLMLRLPEYGDVKVKLTLDRAGQFIKVAVMKAESTANRSYIEKTLPTMRYPSFGGNFGDLAEYTFVITLSNE
jgi:colicin import membrane protein